MDEVLDAIAGWAAGASKGVVFTGAGISTESGIPDFRGPGGFWERNDVAKYTFQNYVADPEHRKERWRQAVEKTSFMGSDAKPNAGHLAIARLEELGVVRGVITQNVDGLHHDAGSAQVLELHGTARRVTCLSCHEGWPTPVILERVVAGEEDPSCTYCGGILKSATVSFGQSMPVDVVEECHRWSVEADFFLVVGSSLVVYPAASFPSIAKRSGASLAIINREPTEQDGIFDAVIHGSAGESLAAIVSRVEVELGVSR